MQPPRWGQDSKLIPLAIFAVAALVYLNTLGNGFVWDDSLLILRNPHIADWGYVKTMFTSERLWRPLKRLTLMVDYAIWGRERPGGFHLTNILLHASCCLALYALVRRLAASDRIAAVTALLFAVHPLHVEAVAPITHRKEPLSLLFDLLGFLAYLAARSSARRGFLARAGFFALTLAAYLAGMLSKDVGAVMLPVVILVYELALRATSARERVRAILMFLGLAVPVFGVFWYRGAFGSFAFRFTGEEIHMWVTHGETDSYARVAMASIKAFGQYIGLLFWPWPLYLDRYFTLPERLTEPAVLVGCGLLLVYLVVLVGAFRRSRLAFFALAWYGLNWLPVSNLIPLTHWLIAERFVYVPSVGFALLMAVWLEELFEGRALPGVAPERQRRIGFALLATVVVVHAGITVSQNRVWKNEMTLWSKTIRYNPDSYRANYGLALQLEGGKRDRSEAEGHYLRAIAVGPWDPEPIYGLAMFYLRAERWADAAQMAERYSNRRPEDSRPWMVIGNARLGEGRYHDAASAYRVAIERDASTRGARFNLANALNAGGNLEPALEVITGVEAEWASGHGSERPTEAMLALKAKILERIRVRDAAAAAAAVVPDSAPRPSPSRSPAPRR